MNELDLFAAAIAIADPAERAALLDRECAGRSDLRQRLDQLLAAHVRTHPLLDAGGRDATGAYVPTPSLVGTLVAGRYKLLELIGEGGMGAVFVAEQTAPVRRKVALKLIKPGMDSKQVLARFEAERQALAVMDHPNIAKVLDGGLTDTGRPFFVMEYVKGAPITDYCDATRLNVPERLQLFVQVCQAVQHAHQKGIIHRDLKPSNVLVAPYDDKPVVKVIDFGLAKAMHISLTDLTVHTRHDTILGTPRYMSPEQVQLNNLDVDTRTDIYSLGVLLYELLTGTTPLENRRIKEAAWDEILRLVREEEPPRPSTRLSSTTTLPSLAACRRTDPGSLTRLVQGELDWIVMKALDKERGRRYESAGAFALDVQYYLAGEAVSAVPPSAGYRLRKFVRRNRGPVLAGTLLIAALLLGVIGTSIGLVLADAARRRAVAAERNEHDVRQKVDAARRAAERTAASLQIDLDLVEMQQDPRLGLLRLARRVRTLPAELRDLREFAAISVLAAGQDYAPFLPPITHDGHEVVLYDLAQDGRTLLTLGKDDSARLWDTRTARQIAVLRRDGERVINCRLSPDGRTAVTDTVEGVLRFWNVPSGTFRVQTEPRPAPFSQVTLADFDQGFFHTDDGPLQNTLHVATNRVLTKRDDSPPPGVSSRIAGPVDLWDSTTGRRIARLDQPEMDVDRFQFTADGRWVTTTQGRDTVIVFSADNGREIARLTHQNLSPNEAVLSTTTLNRGWMATVVGDPTTSEVHLRIWETGGWQQLPITVPLWGTVFDEVRVEDLDDEHFAIFGGPDDWSIYRHGATKPIAQVKGAGYDALAGEIVHDGYGQVSDVWTGRRLLPPAGRRWHPDLARFAPNGRFIALPKNVPYESSERGTQIIDTQTDKTLETDYDVRQPGFSPPPPRLGRSGVAESDWGYIMLLPCLPRTDIARNHVAQTYWGYIMLLLIPTTPPDVPPDLLEQWAQVAVRGEIGPDGSFVRWDEPTWERKRQELAAQPVPFTKFPFPGHVATDRLHWLRREFVESEDQTERRRLAEELLRRSEAMGDRSEAKRWRTAIAKLPPLID